ncbi:uncharacterized protein LOC122849140 isoform X2 [Aphidius gifuensis]|uniref:uncharacterized protein LOC122849140 isoform X2 n=1 Tax=Aphidius gifuensis TaxID=684658 RepID=UPI001CDC660D|nr:uncharacterized protein LOC122849140 isoform X2 [Aphidius gifuensis]XP_044003706.1 uncharacterized protein LOC122849140 isoform X2 [Aphidius gifuensis]
MMTLKSIKMVKKKLKLTAVPSIEINVKPLSDDHMEKLKIFNDSVVRIKKNVRQLDKQVSGNKNPVCLKNDVLSVRPSAGSEHILRSNKYNNIQKVDEVFLDDQSIITVENKNAPSVMEGKQDLLSETRAGPLCCKEINNQSMIIDEENFDDENTVIKNISNPFVMEGKQDLPSETGAGPLCCKEINNQSMIIDKENNNDENTVIKDISNPFVIMGEKQDLSPKIDKVTSQGLSSQSSHRRHSFPEINNDKPTVSHITSSTKSCFLQNFKSKNFTKQPNLVNAELRITYPCCA